MALAVMTAFVPMQASAAEGIEIVQAHIESTEEGYRLSSTFAFELNRGLEDVISRGIPLYFTTEVEMKRPRWYWFDDQAVNTSRTVRVSYDVLTRQYQAGVVGRLQQSFTSLDEALSMVRRPARWLIAERGALKIGENYRVSVRLRLDLTLLGKPFQMHAINDSDWRLSSDWKNFNYKAE
ncbi:MAG: hypothetical protein K0S28_197 [Paucimonas sp.]|jgi:hypothetical protein|nr:hypothetical protein [Paucimonas sp.]